MDAVYKSRKAGGRIPAPGDVFKVFKGDGVYLCVSDKTSALPELEDKVAFVYAHPLSKGGGSSGHYGGNPETYMNVGEAMGKAMVELLSK